MPFEHWALEPQGEGLQGSSRTGSFAVFKLWFEYFAINIESNFSYVEAVLDNNLWMDLQYHILNMYKQVYDLWHYKLHLNHKNLDKGLYTSRWYMLYRLGIQSLLSIQVYN